MGVSIGKFAEEHFLIPKKYLNVRIHINGSNNFSISANINIVAKYCIDEPESCMQSNESNGRSEDPNIVGTETPMVDDSCRHSSMDRLINLLSDMGQSHSAGNYNEDGNIYSLFHSSRY